MIIFSIYQYKKIITINNFITVFKTSDLYHKMCYCIDYYHKKITQICMV